MLMSRFLILTPSRTRATYTEPKQYTQGISTVIVNGCSLCPQWVQTGITWAGAA